MSGEYVQGNCPDLSRWQLLDPRSIYTQTIPKNTAIVFQILPYFLRSLEVRRLLCRFTESDCNKTVKFQRR